MDKFTVLEIMKNTIIDSIKEIVRDSCEPMEIPVPDLNIGMYGDLSWELANTMFQWWEKNGLPLPPEEEGEETREEEWRPRYSPDNIFYQNGGGDLLRGRMPQVRLPPLVPGTLTYNPVKSDPRHTVEIKQSFPFTFFPSTWRLEVQEGSVQSLRLKQVYLGVSPLYPILYTQEVGYGFVSRKQAALVAELQKKHEEGVTVEEAIRTSSLKGWVMGGGMECRWVFFNEGKEPVTFSLVLEGKEIA